MEARSALFDVYGDHLRRRGSQAPVAALVRLLEPVGIAGPAVRTAIHRMVAQGWLEPVHLPEGRGYRTTARADQRLAEARKRVYGVVDPWDHRWHLAFVNPPEGRAARSRLRAALTFIGYAQIADNVWVSPYRRAELVPVLDREGASVRTALADGFDPEPTAAWDLERLRAAYDGWLADAETLVEKQLAAHDDPDQAAFAARFHLVHEWRKFLFDDPGLPDTLLPDDWPRRPAADLFAETANRLEPAADRFVERCLGG
jgi:phenylacetic acid degradation operon negative regulatory protein